MAETICLPLSDIDKSECRIASTLQNFKRITKSRRSTKPKHIKNLNVETQHAASPCLIAPTRWRNMKNTTIARTNHAPAPVSRYMRWPSAARAAPQRAEGVIAGKNRKKSFRSAEGSRVVKRNAQKEVGGHCIYIPPCSTKEWTKYFS